MSAAPHRPVPIGPYRWRDIDVANVVVEATAPSNAAVSRDSA